MIPSFFPSSAPPEVPSGEKRNGCGPSQIQGALGFPFCFSLGWSCLTLTHKITWFFKFSIHGNGGKLHGHAPCVCSDFILCNGYMLI